MKLVFMLNVISLVTLAYNRKVKWTKKGYNNIDDDRSSEEETFPTPEAIFDLTGMVRKYFAVEAALVDPDQNVICSPISALLPLGKLALGTVKGESREELLDAIGSTRLTVQRTIRDLMKTISNVPGVAMTVISRLFMSNKLKMSRKYLESIQPLYGSTVQKLDFKKQAESVMKVNDWVYDHTNGMIQNILNPEDITPYTSILLVNAVYFLGFWKYPFQDVFYGSFHSPRGLKRIEFMKAQNFYSYYQSRALSAQIIELPYESDNASFVIVLPLSKSGLPHLINELKADPDLLNIEMAKMSSELVAVILPKFKIESELDLKSLYEKLGVMKIFTEKSGLNKISDSPLYVSKAIQKAVIQVMEKGTEAAAASVMNMVHTSLYNDATNFNADHSFLFYIKVGGEQLFAGIFNGV